MKITRESLYKAINALRKCAEQESDKEYGTGDIIVPALCNDVADYLEGLDKTEEELEEMALRRYPVRSMIPNTNMDYEFHKRKAYRQGMEDILNRGV